MDFLGKIMLNINSTLLIFRAMLQGFLSDYKQQLVREGDRALEGYSRSYVVGRRYGFGFQDDGHVL